MSSAAVELSPEEAATKLGKSVRQIRYMMQEGRLPARKSDNQKIDPYASCGTFYL